MYNMKDMQNLGLVVTGGLGGKESLLLIPFLTVQFIFFQHQNSSTFY